jgi:hypothetical protein
MSFTDLLRKARSSRIAMFHKFLTNYDPNSKRVYAFVEGDADEAFYRGQIQKYVLDQRLVYTYNCEGKSGVADAYTDIVRKYPNCERVLFFLDKDVDDIVGVRWPSDPRIFVTDCYSIENYVVDKQALSRYFKDYVKIRKIEVDVDTVLEQFEADLAYFHKMMLPVMAWIVIMRRNRCRVNLQDIDPGELFRVTDDGSSRKPRRFAIAYLTRVTQATAPSPTWAHLRVTCKELKRLPAKTYVRGKFEAWWFAEFGRRILEGVQRVVTESGGSIKTSMPLHPNTFIQLLAAGIATPDSLDAFLSFHTRRGPAQGTSDSGQADGILQRIAKIIKSV